jgi:drug/metabolite transporter (DMT)-like permease
MKSTHAVSARPPAKWAVVLAFALVYLSWGTTFLAIKKGVEYFPPALFSGFRLGSAGLLILAYMAVRGQPAYLALREFLWTAFVGILMFVGGNGLLTLGEKISVASGVASILGATTPLFIALFETMWPRGERLTARGWFGLFVGLGGVLLLLAPELEDPAALLADAGPWFILGSSVSWALGSVVMRYRRIRGSYLAIAAYQLIVGGAALVGIGWASGEFSEVGPSQFTFASVYSFFHLLVFGSLVGFVAYVWLLGHVSATLVGTHSYVNPAVAVLAGWLLNNESITAVIAGGMVIILMGVALVRTGGMQVKRTLDIAPALRDKTKQACDSTSAGECAEYVG